MIIFDLDGTLANCEHRRAYVDPRKSVNHILQGYDGNGNMIEEAGVYCNIIDGKRFKPNWKAFYEACDQDKPITAVLDAFIHLTQGEPFNHDVQIWSGRCESVREKTLNWLVNLTGYCEDFLYWNRRLKMRPIGDSTPDDVLKERWLDQVSLAVNPISGSIRQVNPVDFVFDSDLKSIQMWRRRGVFVFNCVQHDEEF